MTEVWDLKNHPADPLVRGADALEAVMAVREVDGMFGMDMENQGMIVFRQPRAIVFMPATKHVHDQECFRA